MFIVTRRRSFAEYWKYFVARFSNVHAFGYNSTGRERTRMKFGELRVYCLELALTDFGSDLRRSESKRACGSFVFLWGKQWTTLPISGQPNFMKFAHKTWFCDVVNRFGNFFWKFALKGSFFQNNFDYRQRFRTSGRDFSEMITNLGKWSQELQRPHDLDLDVESGHAHTVVHHSSTSMYTPNFTEIGKTFLWMD